jgi:hypothetical protein
MPEVVIVCALLLGREGPQVVVCERDAATVPSSYQRRRATGRLL